MRKDSPEYVKLPETLIALEAEAEKLGWKCSHHPGEDLSDVIGLIFSIPNGRDTRPVDLPLDILAGLPGRLKDISFLGDYQAVLHRDALQIEAQVAASGPGGGMRPIISRQLAGIPGLVSQSEDAERLEPETECGFSRHLGSNWHLSIRSGDSKIEISPMSDFLAALLGRTSNQTLQPVSIKLTGFKAGQHDEALSLLENHAYSYFFDLDLRFGLSLNLATKRRRPLLRRRERSAEAPNFPVNRYAPEPLSLYRYGRTASCLPLLQFLAFYQTLEYFFPIYARESALRRLKTALVDPRFDPRSEGHLNRIMSLAIGQGRSSMGSEREQLRATIRACADRDVLCSLTIPREEPISPTVSSN